MSQAGMDCLDCHGDMQAVSINPNPWLDEPRCDSGICHGSGYAQDQALYRFSREHGGIYCAACHDSTHAIAPSREPNDSIKFIALQGHAGTLDTCVVCHSVMPTSEGPHGSTAPAVYLFSFAPDHTTVLTPGDQVVYTHTLRNTGLITDSYDLSWTSSQGWADAPSIAIGEGTASLPVELVPG